MIKKQMNDPGTSHRDWVTCVRFSPNVDEPVIVSSGRDKTVKVWDMNTFDLKHNLVGHSSYVNAVTVSPDGSLCASGGKDGLAMLWDLNEGKKLSSLDAKGEIHALCFSPNRYWYVRCAITHFVFLSFLYVECEYNANMRFFVVIVIAICFG